MDKTNMMGKRAVMVMMVAGMVGAFSACTTANGPRTINSDTSPQSQVPFPDNPATTTIGPVPNAPYTPSVPNPN